MNKEWWNSLNSNWKELLIRNWLLFVKYNGSLSEYLWDAYGAYDYFLCRSMGLPFNDIDEDTSLSKMIITNHMRAIDEMIIEEMLNMEYIAMDASIETLSPLAKFYNIKVLDFHCNNSSEIKDFSPLLKFNDVYVLDYSDYQLINFEESSNIVGFPNIHYVKCIGWPEAEMKIVLKILNKYNV